MVSVSKRTTGIEVLRIISIVLILLSHIVLHGIFGPLDLNNVTPIGKMNLLLLCPLILGNVGVGLFFCITGYFHRRVKLSKIARLIVQIFIFAFMTVIVCFLIMILFRNSIPPDEFKTLIKSMLLLMLSPITSEGWWFATSYIYLCLFYSPLLDHFLKRLGKKQIIVFGIFILSLYIISEVLESPGKRFVETIFYYSIGYMISIINIETVTDKKINIIIFLTFVLNSLLAIYYYDPVYTEKISSLVYLGLLFTNISLITFLFIRFSRIQGEVSSILTLLSSATFSIYLIHDSIPMRYCLWNLLFPLYNIVNSKYLIALVYLLLLIIFILGIVLDVIFRVFIYPKMHNYLNRLAVFLELEESC